MQPRRVQQELLVHAGVHRGREAHEAQAGRAGGDQARGHEGDQVGLGRRLQRLQIRRHEFFRAVAANYAHTYTIVATNILADGNQVAVEAGGCVTTVRGDLYDNQYLLLFRVEDGRLKACREYADTALVERVLGPPPPGLREPSPAAPVSA